MELFTFAQLKNVAELKHNPGFLLLLDAIQARIDTLSNELTLAKSEDESKLLAQWRAMRDIFCILRGTPEEFAMQLMENSPEHPDIIREFNPPTNTIPPAYIERLQQEFIKRGGKL